MRNLFHLLFYCRRVNQVACRSSDAPLCRSASSWMPPTAWTWPWCSVTTRPRWWCCTTPTARLRWCSRPSRSAWPRCSCCPRPSCSPWRSVSPTPAWDFGSTTWSRGTSGSSDPDTRPILTYKKVLDKRKENRKPKCPIPQGENLIFFNTKTPDINHLPHIFICVLPNVRSLIILFHLFENATQIDSFQRGKMIYRRFHEECELSSKIQKQLS